MIATIGNLLTSIVFIIVVLVILHFTSRYIVYIALLLPIFALCFFLLAPVLGILSPVLAVLIVPLILGGLIYMALSILDWFRRIIRRFHLYICYRPPICVRIKQFDPSKQLLIEED